MADTGTPHAAPADGEGRSLLERADAETLRALFQLTPTFLSISSVDDGRLLDVNEAFVQITGYARDEVLGRRVTDLDLWVDPTLREHGLSALKRGEAVRGLEARFRMKSGEERTMILAGEIMWIDGRQCAVTVLTDITDRTRAERALQDSERRFATLFHANPLPMTIVSLRDGRHLDANDAAARHTGRPREQMLGRTDMELGFGIAPERRDEMTRRLLGAGGVRDMELEYRSASGAVRQVLVNQEVITYDDEPAVLSVFLDITERKQMQAESEAQREEAEALAEAAHLLARSLDLGVVADEIVHRLRRLLRCRAAVLNLLDADDQTLKVQSVSGDVGPLWQPGIVIPPGAALSWEAIREGRVAWSTNLLADPAIRLTPDVRQRVEAAGYRAALVVPLVANARVVGTLAVGDEAGRVYGQTEIRRLEAFAAHAAVAVANARMFRDVSAANRSKDEFLAMLGHELRNPLGTITNAVGVLEQVSSDAIVRDVSAIVGRQTRVLTRLVDDLLDLARVAAGKLALDRKPVDLRDVALRCVDALAQAGRTADHALSIEGGAAPVMGDAARLEQVVANLLDNALKYTPAGGRITIFTGRADAEVVLRVADTGSGIRPELLPRVFDLFAQEPQALDRSRGGLGLGLALVKRLVELHGGSVSARSAGPGQGSEFAIRLPARPATAGADEAPPRPAAPRSTGRRVLIVEDNADARASLRLMLHLAGHEVLEAEDGPSALLQLQSERPDIALIDIGLPRLDGYAVAQIARQRPESKDVFMVAVTGYGQAEDRRRALEAGFDRHVTKPVPPDVLAELLRSGGRASGRGPAA